MKESLGQLFRRTRGAKNLTMRDIREISKLSFQALCALETNRGYGPSFLTLSRALSAYGLKFADLDNVDIHANRRFDGVDYPHKGERL